MCNTHCIRKAAISAALLSLACGPFASIGAPRSAPSDRLEALRHGFLNPPDDARIMMRWWWFGPSVTKEEIGRELRVMRDAGIGGVEIQPVYPVQLGRAKTLPYLSPEFLDAVHHASETARSLGLRVDITLGSGWPYGGPHTPVTEAAGWLRVVQVSVPEGSRSVPIPAMEDGERLIAAFIGGRQVTGFQQDRIEIPAGLSGSDLLYFFIASRTGQQVKRSALGAEGFVLDHYNRAAIQHHLSSVADPLLQAFGIHPPYAVFSDSLEVYGSDWTDNFLAEFQKRRGYDLTPHLPSLLRDTGTNTRAIRHDWGKTLTELAEQGYLQPIHEWARAHGTLFRAQSYGEPPVILSSNQFVDLPEGEHGPYWRRFSAARWASSASHLYGRPLTSTETWTWLHSPSFRATPLDLKAEADRHFIQGINQLIGHGWPYSPPGESEPGWRFYAAAALNDHNPWFDVMPDLARYLQRVSFLLRQGEPVNDVAVYLPTDDAWARLEPATKGSPGKAQTGNVAVDETADGLIGPVLIPAVLNGGYSFDFIDDRAIATVGIPYKVVILPGIERIPLATLQLLQAYVGKGGRVIATRSLPSSGTGLLEEKSETNRIVEIAQQMFASGTPGSAFVASDQDVANALAKMLPSDFAVDSVSAPSVGFVHRRLDASDIYFFANTSNRDVHTTASIRTADVRGEWWNPYDGTGEAAVVGTSQGRTTVGISLAPYESKILILRPGMASSAGSTALAPRAQKHPAQIHTVQTMDLGADWTVTFAATGREITMPRLKPWTEDEATRFYSGRATYRKTIELSESFVAKAEKVILDFGPGVAVEPGLQETPGMHALLDGPVREAAVVTVNGARAGVVWHPPYELDVRKYVHAGSNQVQITVGNTAINGMAGYAAPDYTILNLRYGERFVPQDMQNLQPLPSGILHPITLRAE